MVPRRPQDLTYQEIIGSQTSQYTRCAVDVGYVELDARRGILAGNRRGL